MLAACGGASSSNGGVASIAGSGNAAAATTTPASAADREAALLKAAQCMRNNGVKNFPDPVADSNGGFRLQGLQGLDRNDPATAAAFQKCRSLFAAARPQFSPAQQQKLQNALLAYAKCMRKNGYDMPDPQFGTGGGGPGGGLFRTINRNDPTFQKANTVCRSVLAGAFPGRGPGGGGFGGGGFGGPPPGGGSGGGGANAAPATSGATP
jgi:hypothetical protein